MPKDFWLCLQKPTIIIIMEVTQEWISSAVATTVEKWHGLMASSPGELWAALLARDNLDLYLLLAIGVLTILAFFQLAVFSTPPPVPLKHLPRRPALSILFKPDDISAANRASASSNPALRAAREAEASRARSRMRSDSADVDGLFEDALATGSGEGDETASLPSVKSGVSTEASTVEAPMFLHDSLPDSFAPLLSSSHTEVVLQQLSADLLHAIQAEASVRVREGRHEIPLNKDHTRPQFQLHSPKGGCRISAVAIVGSDNLTLEEDLDVSRATTTRSKPMVKKAQLVLDPPMPLANVAPTLIHIPTLFADKKLPSLRRIQIVRMMMDFVISISSWLEKWLWIIESVCQIHLSHVQITPTFKGREQDNSPEWRLTLAFSGHVQLFGVLPIPFLSVALPTFIIPQPHALISNLLSAQPLASAEIKHENLEEKKVALAVVNAVESWNVDLKVVATPPALCLDVTLPGGGKSLIVCNLFWFNYCPLLMK